MQEWRRRHKLRMSQTNLALFCVRVSLTGFATLLLHYFAKFANLRLILSKTFWLLHVKVSISPLRKTVLIVNTFLLRKTLSYKTSLVFTDLSIGITFLLLLLLTFFLKIHLLSTTFVLCGRSTMSHVSFFSNESISSWIAFFHIYELDSWLIASLYVVGYPSVLATLAFSNRFHHSPVKTPSRSGALLWRRWTTSLVLYSSTGTSSGLRAWWSSFTDGRK